MADLRIGPVTPATPSQRRRTLNQTMYIRIENMKRGQQLDFARNAAHE